MSDNDNDTQDGATGDADAAAAAAASKAAQDPVSLLTSRLNGQTAKVGELTGTLKAKEEALAAALKRVAALETGSVTADEAATARVKAAEEALAKEQNERRSDSLKTRFPETFSVLGEAAFTLEESALAANEARLLGDEGETPTPLRHNETRTGATKGADAKPETAADVRARLEAMHFPWGG